MVVFTCKAPPHHIPSRDFINGSITRARRGVYHNPPCIHRVFECNSIRWSVQKQKSIDHASFVSKNLRYSFGLSGIPHDHERVEEDHHGPDPGTEEGDEQPRQGDTQLDCEVTAKVVVNGVCGLACVMCQTRGSVLRVCVRTR